MGRVVILGGTGMLGQAASKYFSDSYECLVLTREHFDATNRAAEQQLVHYIQQDDVVLNCVGVLKPDIDRVGRTDTIMINTLFPQYASNACNKRGAKMVHICSDCVFAGTHGPYDEHAVCDATDLYGRTKSIIPEDCITLRTSFVGHDVRGKGLLEWVRSMDGKSLQGYTNCLWNGVTTLQLCKFVEDIVSMHPDFTGLMNVFTDYNPNGVFTSISKYELCKMIVDTYNVNADVIPVEAKEISGTPIYGLLDRRLSTSCRARVGNGINKSIQQQLIELKQFNDAS